MSIRGWLGAEGHHLFGEKMVSKCPELPAVLPLGSVPGQPLCQQVEVDATILVRDTWTPHQNALDCKTVDINTHVR